MSDERDMRPVRIRLQIEVEQEKQTEVAEGGIVDGTALVCSLVYRPAHVSCQSSYRSSDPVAFLRAARIGIDC
jgi:hypothetical protein